MSDAGALDFAGAPLAVVVDNLDRLFADAALESPRLDARLLTAAAADLEPSQLYAGGDSKLSPEAGKVLAGFAHRRLHHEPVARILGRRGFWTIELTITPDVLDPRPDSETLVEAVLATVVDRAAPLRILDLCTGSGAILCALLMELPNASGIGSDISPAACAVASANIERLGLAGRAIVVAADGTAGLAGPFDIVTANPPYIRTADLATLDPDVRHFDPVMALDGGADGLDAYRWIASDALRLLKPGTGRMALETGHDQAAAVARLLDVAGLNAIETRNDLAGHERVVMASAPAR